MANLGAIEQKLNSDPRLWGDFLKDPVDVLHREGIDLAPHMQKELRDEAVITSPKPGVAGSTTGQPASEQEDCH